MTVANNPAGAAVKQVPVVKYAHGTREWAEGEENMQHGCQNDCRYCYAKSMAIRFGRKTPDTWKDPSIDNKKVNKGYRKREGRIMFPSSHDITNQNIDKVLQVLKKLLKAGNDLLIVSKPDPACVKRLCESLADYKAHIMFRFTIGSADDKVLKFWEPGAPDFTMRLESLKLAHAQGFATSVSCEPMLDENIDAVVSAVQPFVTDTIWLGKANDLRQRTSINCPGDKEVRARVDQLTEWQNDDAIKALYARYKNDPMIRYKDSIKKVVGLDRPTASGLDI